MANHSAKKIVIFFHGNGGNVSHRLADLLRIKQSGVNVLGVDYRGYGKSEGKPSEKGIYRDGEASLAYAIQELRFSEKNIYLFGRSIGTTVAINTAQKKNLAGLILVSPLTSGKAQAKATGKGVLSFLAGASFRNIDKIQNIACPVLVVHGTNDKIIPYAMGVSVYSAIQTKKKFVTITGAGHNNMRSDFTLEYWHPILDFIKNGI